MTGSLPSGPRIDRGALERIIRRAAELQAAERDIGEGLTDQELLALGQEVGIGERYLRQALLEERTRAVVEPEGGLVAAVAGPRRVGAARLIGRPRPEVEATLHAWLVQGELLQIKRRYPDQVTWEAQQGYLASMKRAFGSGGRRYVLARARELAAAVVAVDPGHCHVQLTADISNALRQHLTGAALVGGSGLAAGAIGAAVGVLMPFAWLPAALGVGLALAVARRQRRRAEETQVALEQVLDRLEHGEADGGRSQGALAGPLERVAHELRRTLGA